MELNLEKPDEDEDILSAISLAYGNSDEVAEESRRQFVRRNSVGVKERQGLLIDNISGSSRLSSNFIYWTRVLLLIELQVTQRMISEA